MKSVSRLAWVDYAKGLGIILVVYAHVLRGVDAAGLDLSTDFFYWSDTLIYSFHMPLFFFLSGMFFSHSLARRGRWGLIVDKSRTIAYPYVVWSLLQGLVYVAASAYTNTEMTLADVLAFAWHPQAQFWFLYALFWMFVIAVVCARVGGRRGLWLLAIVSMAMMAKPSLTRFVVFYPMANGILYFALGGVVMRYLPALMSMRPSVPVLVGIGVVFVASEVVAISLGLVSLVVVRVILASAGIAASVALSSRLSATGRCSWLSVLGRASMPIYLAHILAASGSRIVLQKALGVDDVVIHVLVGTVFGLIVPLVLFEVCQSRGWMYLFKAPTFASRQPDRLALGSVG